MRMPAILLRDSMRPKESPMATVNGANRVSNNARILAAKFVKQCKRRKEAVSLIPCTLNFGWQVP